MSSSSSSAVDWSRQWETMQRQYWDSFNDLSRKASEGMGGGKNHWHEGLEMWNRLFKGGDHAPAPSSSAVFDKIMDQGKAYLGMMEGLFQAGKGGVDGANLAEVVRGWIAKLRAGEGLPGMPAFSLPAGLFQHPHLGSQADFEKAMLEMVPGFFAPLRQELSTLLNMPAFGQNREVQERHQALARGVGEYQQAIQQYNGLMSKVGRRTLELMEDKLLDHSEPGRQISSLRGVYDLWVDAAEDAYSEVALSPEFRKAYGELVNAQMRVRKGVQVQVEALQASLDLPTRSELNGVHRKLAELRRARNAQEVQAEQLQRLNAEVQELKATLARLSAERKAPTAAAKSEVAKPAVAKRSQAAAAVAAKAPAARKPAVKKTPTPKPKRGDPS